MKATPKTAKAFLSKINSKDKVAIICDNDLDGFCSGILFYLFAKDNGAKAKPFIIDAGRPQEKIIRRLRKFNKVIITDLGANKITKILEAVKEKDVFYTDHHPVDQAIPKEILEYRTVKEGYIPSSRTAQELTEGDLWRGLAGVLGDMGHKYDVNNKYIASALKEIGMTQNKFQEDVVFPSNKLIMYFYKNPQKVFKKLAKIKEYKDIRKLSKYTKPVETEIQKYIGLFKHKSEKLGKASYFYFKPHFPIKSTVTTILSLKSPKKIFIFAVPEGKKIKISSRCQGDILDLGLLLKEATTGMKDANAGGHKRAAGCTILKKDLKKFKENVSRLSLGP